MTVSVPSASAFSIALVFTRSGTGEFDSDDSIGHPLDAAAAITSASDYTTEQARAKVPVVGLVHSDTFVGRVVSLRRCAVPPESTSWI